MRSRQISAIRALRVPLPSLLGIGWRVIRWSATEAVWCPSPTSRLSPTIAMSPSEGDLVTGHRGGVLCLSAGSIHSSSSRWALLPPKPKLLIAARRGPLHSQGSAFASSRNGESAKNVSGSSACSVGDVHPHASPRVL